MIFRVIHYHSLRRNNLPHRLAWAMSGLKFYSHKAIKLTAFLLCVAGVLYLLSSEANSAQIEAHQQAQMSVYEQIKAQKQTISKQKSEIAELSKILAKCLTRGDNALWIGDELHFCGMASSGIKK